MPCIFDVGLVCYRFEEISFGRSAVKPTHCVETLEGGMGKKARVGTGLLRAQGQRQLAVLFRSALFPEDGLFFLARRE